MTKPTTVVAKRHTTTTGHLLPFPLLLSRVGVGYRKDHVGNPEHQPYLTCWIAQDDVSEENGTVHVLPFSRIGVRTVVKHVKEEGSNDLVGYFGSEPGVSAVVPAGSIVCFTSVSFRASGANRSPRMRRAYLAQYSAEPLLTPDGTHLWGSAEPFLCGGNVVAGGAPPNIPSRHGGSGS